MRHRLFEGVSMAAESGTYEKRMHAASPQCYAEKSSKGTRLKLEVPSQEATATAADGSGGNGDACKCAGFAASAHNVDRRCRRLGYPGVLHQRPSGAEFLSVPVLMQNCSSLLNLLAVGGHRLHLQSVPEATMRPSRSKPSAPGDNFTSSNNLSCTIAAADSSSAISSHRRSWTKRLFTKRSVNKPVAAAPDEKEQLRAGELEDLTCCLQQLLAGIRHSTERLGSLAGLTTCDRSCTPAASPPPPPLLTRLQREVLYFQTQWPETIDAICMKLTDSGRAAKRQEELAAVRAKAEAGAKARNIAKMANMEAELRRLRAELRRYGRQLKIPQLQLAAKVPMTQKRRFQRRQDKLSEISTGTVVVETSDNSDARD